MSISLRDINDRLTALENKISTLGVSNVYLKKYSTKNNSIKLDDDFKFCILTFNLTSIPKYYRQPMIIEKNIDRTWVGNTWETYSDPFYTGSTNTFSCNGGTLINAIVIYFK